VVIRFNAAASGIAGKEVLKIAAIPHIVLSCYYFFRYVKTGETGPPQFSNGLKYPGPANIDFSIRLSSRTNGRQAVKLGPDVCATSV
jgi:hypothetical protein